MHSQQVLVTWWVVSLTLYWPLSWLTIVNTCISITLFSILSFVFLHNIWIGCIPETPSLIWYILYLTKSKCMQRLGDSHLHTYWVILVTNTQGFPKLIYLHLFTELLNRDLCLIVKRNTDLLKSLCIQLSCVHSTTCDSRTCLNW